MVPLKYLVIGVKAEFNLRIDISFMESLKAKTKFGLRIHFCENILQSFYLTFTFRKDKNFKTLFLPAD
jgi:hypothetical protein